MQENLADYKQRIMPAKTPTPYSPFPHYSSLTSSRATSLLLHFTRQYSLVKNKPFLLTSAQMLVPAPLRRCTAMAALDTVSAALVSALALATKHRCSIGRRGGATVTIVEGVIGTLNICSGAASRP